NLRPKSEERKVSLEVLPISGSLGFITDQKLLSRILYEIVDNAINYSPGGKVEIRAEAQKDGTLITVSDTGIGITENEQPFIFTKFFRGRNFDTTEIVGAGLGLYISKSYADLLGNRLWFESKENQGAKFF